MMVFRPLRAEDFPALCTLTHSSEVGVTSLPHKKSIVQARLDLAVESFHHPSAEKECYYWFLLEDTSSNAPLGVSAIATKVGIQRPFYVYKRVPVEKRCPSLHIIHQDERLELSGDLDGTDELCTLYLHPKARASGLGRFLSRARLLFMGQFRQYFASQLIAELRGVSNTHGRSPFWEAVNKHFFHMSFPKADKLTINTDKQFIADLLPKEPIYVSMLPKAAQEVIGRPHENTVPAMNILLHEGFQAIRYVDIFDAGPIMEAEVKDIKSICMMQKMRVQLVSNVKGPLAMVANRQLAQFRAVQTEIQIMNEQISISQMAGKALNIEDGDYVYFYVP